MSRDTALPWSAWSRPRQWAAAGFIAALAALLVAATLYLAGACFLLLNKLHPRQADWLSIVGLLDPSTAQTPRQQRKLVVASTVPSLALLVLLPVGLASAARPRRALHGDARFATPTEVARAGLLLTADDPAPRQGGPDRPPSGPLPGPAGPAVGDAVGAHTQRKGRGRGHPEPC